MGGEYGRNVIGGTGSPVFVEADGKGEWAPVGVSIDWSLVAAPGGPVTVQPEGLVLQAGQKYLRHGQVLAKVTNTPVQTITGTATGGTFGLSGYRNDTGAYVTVGPLAYNISPANLLAALQAVGAFDNTPMTVTGVAGTSYVITAPLALLTVDATNLTGGTATIALTTAVGNYGYYGPYDAAANDGRQTLSNGNCCVLNATVVQNGVLGVLTNLPSNHPGVLVGGLVWKARVLATNGAHSLAAGPTWAELLAAMPRLQLAGSSPYA